MRKRLRNSVPRALFIATSFSGLTMDAHGAIIERPPIEGYAYHIYMATTADNLGHLFCDPKGYFGEPETGPVRKFSRVVETPEISPGTAFIHPPIKIYCSYLLNNGAWVEITDPTWTFHWTRRCADKDFYLSPQTVKTETGGYRYISSEIDSIPQVCQGSSPSFADPQQCPSAGNPTHIPTGVKIEEALDFSSPSSRGLALKRRYASGGAISQGAFGAPTNGVGGWTMNHARSLSLSASLYGSGHVRQYTETSWGWVPKPDGAFGPSQDFFYINRPDGRSLYAKADGDRLVNEAAPDEWAKKITRTSGEQSWIYISASTNEVEQYSPNGLLLMGLSAHNGVSKSLSYSDGTPAFLAVDANGVTATPLPAGKLVAVADDFGRRLRFSYDLSGRIVQIDTPDDRSIRYTYSSTGDLASVIYPDGSTKSYLHNESGLASASNRPGLLTGIIDESGSRYSTFKYDGYQRVVQSSHPSGADLHSFTYWSNGGMSSPTRVTDPLGTIRDYFSSDRSGVAKSTGVSQPGGSGCSASSSAIAYDSNGNVTSRTDFTGLKTCYANDLTRNLETARLEGFAASTACPTDLATATPAAGQRKTSTQWHPFWRLEARRAEPRRITTWIYNGQPDPTSGNAIARCAPVEATLPDGQPIAVLCKQIEQPTTDATGSAAFAAAPDGPARTWTYTYNTYGQVLSANGPRTDLADTTTYTYYPDTTAAWTRGDLKSVTNALGHTWSYTQYDKAGRLLAATDPNGTAYTFTYTPRGWLKTRSIAGQTTTYDYTPWGGLARVTLPDASYTAYTWDPAHRLTDISDSLGNTTHFTLDNAGNITASETRDAQGRVAHRTRTDFDALGRPWKHYDSAGNVTETRHDAMDRLNAVVDPAGRTTTYARDTFGRLRDITDPLPTPGHTGFDYDALDQLTRFVAPNGATTAFTADGLGNPRQESGPDRGSVNATFDAAGNLLTRTDARGQTLSHTYDALNRLTQTQLKTATGTIAQIITYLWDYGAGCLNGIGRLCKVADGAVSTLYTYDARGNRLAETRLEGGKTFTTQYTYNAADRLVAILTPTGTLLDQARDAAGRVQALTATQGSTVFPVASAITYDGAGEPVQLTQGSGLTHTLQRNEDGRLGFSTLGLAPTALSVSLSRRFIRPAQSLTFTVALNPVQAGGTLRLCRLDCQGTNKLAEGPASSGKLTGTLSALPLGVHHLYATFSPTPPYAPSTSPTRRLLVGVAPNLFFEDLIP